MFDRVDDEVLLSEQALLITYTSNLRGGSAIRQRLLKFM
jgi:hypothetical protein